MRIKKSAKEALALLVTKTRPNGNEYLSFKTGAPEWCKNLAGAAHDDRRILPDDNRYRFMSEALDAIAGYDDLDDARDSLEADIYTSELTAWLNSRNDRTCYVDETIRESGKGETLDHDLMMGQLLEKQEVFQSVVEYLESIDDEDEEATA